MGKIERFLASHRFVQTIVTLLCMVALLFTYYRMKVANSEMTEYFLAKSCSIPGNCREKVKAKIMDSYGLTVFVKGFRTKHSSLPSSRNTHYGIVLSSQMGTSEIEINANPPSNGTPFDIPNVHIPTGRDTLFVDENLYKNQTVYVESWKQKITILYIDEIVDVPAPVIQPTPNPDAQPAFVNNPSPKTYEIALPTTVHPIFRQAGMERDFFATCLICFMLLSILYSGELNGISQLVTRRKNRKVNDD